MGSISMTIVDSSNGLMTTSVKIDDAGIHRIYNALRVAYEEELNTDAGNIDEETGRPVEKVTLTTREICTKLAVETMNSLLGQVYNIERKEAYKKIQAPFIDVQLT